MREIDAAAAASLRDSSPTNVAGGAFLLFEDAMEQGKVTPCTRTPKVDDAFYLLVGEISLYLDGSPAVRSHGETGRVTSVDIHLEGSFGPVD